MKVDGGLLCSEDSDSPIQTHIAPWSWISRTGLLRSSFTVSYFVMGFLQRGRLIGGV